MSYVLYEAPRSASLAVHWLLIELKVEFRTIRLDLKVGEHRTPHFLKLNPMGRVPTLVVDGAAYGESAALLMMLADRHPEAGLAPAIGDARRLRWLEMMVYLANTLSSAMRDWFYADRDGDPADADAVRRLARHRIESVWDRLNTVLGDERAYLLGNEMTTADLLATMLMRWTGNMPRPATEWAQIGPYMTRMSARPAFIETCRREALTSF